MVSRHSTTSVVRGAGTSVVRGATTAVMWGAMTTAASASSIVSYFSRLCAGTHRSLVAGCTPHDTRMTHRHLHDTPSPAWHDWCCTFTSWWRNVADIIRSLTDATPALNNNTLSPLSMTWCTIDQFILSTLHDDTATDWLISITIWASLHPINHQFTARPNLKATRGLKNNL